MTTTTDTLTHFTITMDRHTAIVTMDLEGESMNTLGPKLIDDFELVLRRLETDPNIRAVVLTSGKRDFLVGADIRFFDELTTSTAAEEAIRTTHALFARLEKIHTRLGKPVVAAIDGNALGGGLELALACSMRIATDSPRTQLGQPETQLGVIPAGGGTQRLPKVIGIANALDMILAGKNVRVKKAKALGLVDEVVPPEMLIEIAVDRARSAIGSVDGKSSGFDLSPSGLQKAALETNPIGRNILFKQARQKLLAQTKGNYPAPERALEAIRIGVEEGPEAGYAAEARFFGELVVSPESAALRSIFFAQRAVDRETWVDAEPIDVNRVAMIGGGLMGGGIAAVTTLKAGAEVRIKEIDHDGVGRAMGYVQKVVDGRVKRRHMRPFEGEKAMLRVSGSVDWTGFADTDLVIEAVFESLDLKRSIVAEVEAVTSDRTVFASNTSSIPISDIAEGASRPEAVVGMHYFSPVEKMPLLEVIVTDQTADWALATAVAFGKRQGKTVIVVNDGPGFYTSRVLGPYGVEAFHLLSEGASVEAIDAAIEQWGMPVGPMRLSDEVGLDVQAKIGRIMIDAFGDRMAAPGAIARLEADDRKGRKNRRGFYLYDANGERSGPDETVYAALGLGPRREISASEITERITLAFVNEAARCLEEGILRSARDGDIGAVFGLGFPPFRGGPFFWVDQMGAGTVVAALDRLAEQHGTRFEAAQILRDHAESGERFRS